MPNKLLRVVSITGSASRKGLDLKSVSSIPTTMLKIPGKAEIAYPIVDLLNTSDRQDQILVRFEGGGEKVFENFATRNVEVVSIDEYSHKPVLVVPEQYNFGNVDLDEVIVMFKIDLPKRGKWSIEYGGSNEETFPASNQLKFFDSGHKVVVLKNATHKSMIFRLTLKRRRTNYGNVWFKWDGHEMSQPLNREERDHFLATN